MTSESRDEFLKNSIIKQIMESVSFGELVKILHSIAAKEADEVISVWTETEKQDAYDEFRQLNKANETSDSSSLQEI